MPLAIINTDAPRTTTTTLPIVGSDATFSIRWTADDDFGDFGGGEAGFTSEDVVVRGPVQSALEIPALRPAGSLLLMLALAGIGLALTRLRRDRRA